MKTKRSHLAPMEVASLLGGVRPARYNVQRDDSCVAQRSSASRKKYYFCWLCPTNETTYYSLLPFGLWR